MEADTFDFIKEDSSDAAYNPSDDELLKLVEKELAKGEPETVYRASYIRFSFQLPRTLSVGRCLLPA